MFVVTSIAIEPATDDIPDGSASTFNNSIAPTCVRVNNAISLCISFLVELSIDLNNETESREHNLHRKKLDAQAANEDLRFSDWNQKNKMG